MCIKLHTGTMRNRVSLPSRNIQNVAAVGSTNDSLLMVVSPKIAKGLIQGAFTEYLLRVS